MPNYNYRCGDCGDLQVIAHASTEKPVVVCPHCGYFAEKVLRCNIGMIQQMHQDEAETPLEHFSGHQCGSSCVLHQHLPKK